MNTPVADAETLTPPTVTPEEFTDATAAVDRLCELYTTATEFLCKNFSETLAGKRPTARIRAFYPEIRITTTSHARTDTRLSFGDRKSVV